MKEQKLSNLKVIRDCIELVTHTQILTEQKQLNGKNDHRALNSIIEY
jgi:hypothetical protein